MDNFGRLPNELIEYIATLYHAPIAVKWYHVKDRDPRKEYINTIVAWSTEQQKIVFCARNQNGFGPSFFNAWDENGVKFEWWAEFEMHNYIHLLVDKPPL
jgi:hypothetical protein